MINKVILEGRITKDLELRKTTSGLSVCGFTLACNRRKQQDGTQLADYPQIQVWRSSAEYLCNYAKKGTLISVCGRLQTRSYNDNDGRKVYVTEVLAEDVSILAQPQGTQYEGTQQESVGHEQANDESSQLSDFNDLTFNSDDLPFY